MSRIRSLGALTALAAFAVAAPASAKVFLTTDEALKLAFPGCAVERKTVYLTDGQLKRASELSGQPVTQALTNPYVATCDGKLAGTAYFDVHRVRTLPETIMIVVAPDATVRRIEVLAFNEPEDYLPRPLWYGQFVGKKLDDQLALKQSIRPIAGATLTARATTDAVRKILGVHQVISTSGSPQK